MQKDLSSSCSVGYEDVGTGRPVVWLHAFPLARAMWRPQIEALRETCRVVAPDLRGFGGTSGFSGRPSLEQMAADVAGLLDALGIAEPVVLGGLSMGGYVALAFARAFPARLRALILADTRAEADSEEAKANRDKLIAFAQAHTAGDVLDQMLPKLLSAETRDLRPEVVEEVRRLASAQTVAGIVGALQAMRDRPDASSVLGTIGVPTLVLVGSEDALTPPALADALAAGIRGAHRVTLDEAGHLSNLEDPQRFNEAVQEFLHQLP